MKIRTRSQLVLSLLFVMALLAGQVQSVAHAFEHLDTLDTSDCVDCPALKNFQHSLASVDAPSSNKIHPVIDPGPENTALPRSYSSHYPVRAPPAT